MVEFLLLALASFGAMARSSLRPVLIADAASALVRSPSCTRQLSAAAIDTGAKPDTEARGVADRRRPERVARAAGAACTDQADSRATK
jgi:hypothetical protein